MCIYRDICVYIGVSANSGGKLLSRFTSVLSLMCVFSNLPV